MRGFGEVPRETPPSNRNFQRERTFYLGLSISFSGFPGPVPVASHRTAQFGYKISSLPILSEIWARFGELICS